MSGTKSQSDDRGLASELVVIGMLRWPNGAYAGQWGQQGTTATLKAAGALWSESKRHYAAFNKVK